MVSFKKPGAAKPAPEPPAAKPLYDEATNRLAFLVDMGDEKVWRQHVDRLEPEVEIVMDHGAFMILYDLIARKSQARWVMPGAPLEDVYRRLHRSLARAAERAGYTPYERPKPTPPPKEEADEGAGRGAAVPGDAGQPRRGAASKGVGKPAPAGKRGGARPRADAGVAPAAGRQSSGGRRAAPAAAPARKAVKRAAPR